MKSGEHPGGFRKKMRNRIKKNADRRNNKTVAKEVYSEARIKLPMKKKMAMSR